MVKRLSSTDQNEQSLTNVPTPVDGGDAANKDYVDANAGGLNYRIETVNEAVVQTTDDIILADGISYIELPNDPTGYEDKYITIVNIGGSQVNVIEERPGGTATTAIWTQWDSTTWHQETDGDSSWRVVSRADWSEDKITTAMSNISSSYVPYSGAAGDVNLGTNNLFTPNITAPLDTGITLNAGPPSTTDMPGSSAIVYGSSASGLGNGGSAAIVAGNADTDGDGGDVYLQAGGGTGAGSNGRVQFYLGNSANYGEISLDLLTGVRSWNFPDADGTFATEEYVDDALTGVGGVAVVAQDTAPSDTDVMWYDTDEPDADPFEWETTTDIEVTDAAKGIILKSPDGTRWRVTVNDSGNIVTTSL